MVKTPDGVRDILPAETRKRLGVIKQLTSVFEDSGYEQILPPTLENYDYIKEAFPPSLDSEVLKFFGPEGLVLALRPDFTTSVARVVATRMKEITEPLRLFYSGDVYRVKKFGSETQFHQIGLELINLPTAQGDKEILTLAEKAMEAIGINNYRIVKNNMEYLSQLSPEKKNSLHNLDFVSLGRLPKEDEVVPGDTDYYTGLYFEIYIEGIGYPIGSGGRYDTLLSNFGDTRNAVGFALNLSRIMDAKGKN